LRNHRAILSSQCGAAFYTAVPKTMRSYESCVLQRFILVR
ncbi:hypothetical protein T11_16748, partial [Trichinella zimbabwensis]